MRGINHIFTPQKHVVFEVDESLSNKRINIYVDDDYVMTAHVGKSGIIKLSRKNKIGNMITEAVNSDRIKLLL